MARQSGLSVRTIDYYTQIGLLSPVRRSPSNYRYYGDDALIRLRWIERLKAEKYTLEEIREWLNEMDHLLQEGNLRNLAQRMEEVLASLEQAKKELAKLTPALSHLQSQDHGHAAKQFAARAMSTLQGMLVLLSNSPPPV